MKTLFSKFSCFEDRLITTNCILCQKNFPLFKFKIQTWETFFVVLTNFCMFKTFHHRFILSLESRLWIKINYICDNTKLNDGLSNFLHYHINHIFLGHIFVLLQLRRRKHHLPLILFLCHEIFVPFIYAKISCNIPLREQKPLNHNNLPYGRRYKIARYNFLKAKRWPIKTSVD